MEDLKKFKSIIGEKLNMSVSTETLLKDSDDENGQSPILGTRRSRLQRKERTDKNKSDAFEKDDIMGSNSDIILDDSDFEDEARKEANSKSILNESNVKSSLRSEKEMKPTAVTSSARLKSSVSTPTKSVLKKSCSTSLRKRKDLSSKIPKTMSLKKIKIKNKNKNEPSDDSDFEDDSFRPVSRTKTRNNSSTATIKVDNLEINELEKELEKLEKLKQLLSRKSSVKSSNNSTSKKSQISKTKLSESVKSVKTLKPKAVREGPKIIERGPIDCFDDLITERTDGSLCRVCEEEKRTVVRRKRRELIRHVQTEHRDKLTEQQRWSELAGVFPCRQCSVLCYSKHILRTHTRAHAKVQKPASCDKYYKLYLKYGNKAL